MLSVTGGTSRRDCRGTSRREFLRIGSLGIGGLPLADWLLEPAGRRFARAIANRCSNPGSASAAASTWRWALRST